MNISSPLDTRYHRMALRTVVAILGAVLVLSNVWWAYRSLNDAVYEAHSEDEAVHARQTANATAKIVAKLAEDMNRDQLMGVCLEALDDDRDLVFEKGSDLVVGGAVYQFVDGHLVGVALD